MSQAKKQWKQFVTAFYQDGSLRDLYVLGTVSRDWDSAISFVSNLNYKMGFSGAWEQPSPPPDIASMFPTGPDSELTMLSLDLSGIIINCHFFTEARLNLI